MKFFLSLAVHVAFAVVLGLGILLTVHGQVWLLLLAGAAYFIGLVRFGCLGH